MPRKRTKPRPKKRLTPEEKLILANVEHMDVSLADTSFANPNQEYYDDFISREKVPVTARQIEILGQELIEWARNDPSATRITKFFLAKGIYRQTATYWTNHFPTFKKDYETAKLCIADRLFDGVLTKIYADKLVSFQMPMLDDEWKEESKRIANIKEEQRISDMMRPIKIVLQDFSKDDDEG